MNYYKILVFSLIIGFKLQSQNDSLYKALKSPSTHDTIKLEAAYVLAADMLYSKPDSALILSNYIIQNAIKNRSPYWEANGYTIKGAYYFFISDRRKKMYLLTITI